MHERVIAIHEAGHAVAFYLLKFREMGLLNRRLSMVPHDGKAGTFQHEEILFEEDSHLSEAEQDEVFHNVGIFSCGGYAAVIAAGFSEEKAVEGCCSDFETASQHGELESLQQEAIELLSTNDAKKAVNRVAAELLESRTIDAETLDMLLRVCFGELTEEDFQAWRYLSGE